MEIKALNAKVTEIILMNFINRSKRTEVKRSLSETSLNKRAPLQMRRDETPVRT